MTAEGPLYLLDFGVAYEWGGAMNTAAALSHT
jgi:hypothetical protein